jgi:hypothetical protein
LAFPDFFPQSWRPRFGLAGQGIQGGLGFFVRHFPRPPAATVERVEFGRLERAFAFLRIAVRFRDQGQQAGRVTPLGFGLRLGHLGQLPQRVIVVRRLGER